MVQVFGIWVEFRCFVGRVGICVDRLDSDKRRAKTDNYEDPCSSLAHLGSALGAL